ncbi:hypothetical protein EW145_g7119 [Phellinidium pouzarii]|uniref:Muskelin N-terminal domain-containing protein n=1 Tax=Phellinidium pouzarii TaxID=167371 RepID=A0A4S4KNW0_9AGAM|nr:hypothetical protein EW145_g7119 [Phellinidium pouzarii]
MVDRRRVSIKADATSSFTVVLIFIIRLDMPKPSSVQIKYSIAGCSEHSGRYVADNIKYDRPLDQSSRWSSSKDNAVNGKSWILIEMDTVAVLGHPCNMKDFEIHVGMSRDHLTDVLHSTLKNDTKQESFPLTHKSKEGVPFPTRFVKIVSVSAHGHNFNTSVWYVSLLGITDEVYVRRIKDGFVQNKETVAMRHVLKHLRQRRHITTYQQLLFRTGVPLEHPLISQLYETLVLQGAWSAAEQKLDEIASTGLFSSYIHACTPQARWRRLRGTDANGDFPCKRGGHAMCMDVENELIYLFGGYDGQKSLDDFWVYSLREGRWKVISHSVVEEKNGPGPRACHKMVFDPKSGCIYMLGRLGDGDLPTNRDSASAQAPSSAAEAPSMNPPEAHVQSAWRHRQSVGVDTSNTQGPPTQSSADGQQTQPSQGNFSEFHRYRTRGLDQGKWELLNVDTAIVNGPKLVYDHQLVLDSEAQVLYVQGGRVVDTDWSTPKYSGLFSYDLRSGKWTTIQAITPETAFPPRFGHSMVFEPFKKKLLIFAGQKDESYLADMWEYDIPSRTMDELFQNVTAVGGPEACFAQRAVIDPELKEVYVFGGLTKKSSILYPGSGLPVSLYRYDTNPGTWVRVPIAENSSQESQSRHPSVDEKRNDMDVDDGVNIRIGEDESVGPLARCACQVVYDSRTQTFYLHGGNAGQVNRASSSRTRGDERLDDLWSMRLERPSDEEVIRRATFEIRRQQFREMCEETAPVTALAFLQNKVSAVVNHENPEEATVFRSLLSHLFEKPPTDSESSAPPLPFVTPTPRMSRSPSSSKSGSGEWTNSLKTDEDTVMSDAGAAINSRFSRSNTSHSLLEPVNDDPYELELRKGKSLSGARFAQRTEVFESLLKFVEKGENDFIIPASTVSVSEMKMNSGTMKSPLQVVNGEANYFNGLEIYSSLDIDILNIPRQVSSS